MSTTTTIERDAAVAAYYYDLQAGSNLAGSAGMMIAQRQPRPDDPLAVEREVVDTIARARRLRQHYDHPAPSWETDEWVLTVIKVCERRLA